ncbi:MAG: archease [Promethearchaeota archaeon]
MQFEYFDDVTSDQMFRAYGKDLPEVFKHAAMAMFGIMFDLEEVKLEEEVVVEAMGASEELLLFDWLSNLLFEFEVRYIFFADFNITAIERDEEGNLHLTGLARGSLKPQERTTHVKAVTFHRFRLEKIDNRYEATVVVDV